MSSWPSFGLVVGTFGSDEWKVRGDRTLREALESNKFDAWQHYHGDNLGRARNLGARWCGDVDYIVFLDADDCLSDNYLEAMREKAIQLSKRSDYPEWLIQPSTLGIYSDGTTDEESVLIPPKNIFRTNFLVIGTACPKGPLDIVGGFDEELPVLEDWDLWLNILTTTHTGVSTQPDAIYGVGVNESSRNSDTRLHGRIYSEIRNKYRRYGQELAKVKVV